jgi:hypothetical protein
MTECSQRGDDCREQMVTWRLAHLSGILASTGRKCRTYFPDLSYLWYQLLAFASNVRVVAEKTYQTSAVATIQHEGETEKHISVGTFSESSLENKLGKRCGKTQKR